MYNNILVPLDGSKRAEAILPHVEELSQHYKAKVLFLQIVEPTYSRITVEGAYLEQLERE